MWYNIFNRIAVSFFFKMDTAFLWGDNMFNFLKKEDKEFKMEEIFYPLSPRDDVDEKDIY